MKRLVSSSFSWKLSYKPRSCLNRMGGTAKQFSKDLRISFRFIISNQCRVFTRWQIFSPMQSSIMSSHLYMRARHLCHLASRCWRPTHKSIILLTTTWWFRIKTSIKYKGGRHISNSQYSGITWHLANKINFCYNLSLKNQLSNLYFSNKWRDCWQWCSMILQISSPYNFQLNLCRRH